jgi:hypothetical protein
MTTAQQRKVLDYIKARRAMKAAELALLELKQPIWLITEAAGGKLEEQNALIYIGESVSYDYPMRVQQQENKLRQLKIIMQKDGRAERVNTPCLMFKDLRNGNSLGN